MKCKEPAILVNVSRTLKLRHHHHLQHIICEHSFYEVKKNLQALLLLLQKPVGSSKTVNNYANATQLLSQMPENKSKH